MNQYSFLSEFIVPLISAGLGTAAGAFVVNHANEEKLFFETNTKRINNSNYVLIQSGNFLEELFNELLHVKKAFDKYKENQKIAIARYSNFSTKNPRITRICKLTHEINFNAIKNNLYQATDDAVTLTLFSKLLQSTQDIKIFDKDLAKEVGEIVEKLKIDEKSAIAEYFGISYNRIHNDSIEVLYNLLIQSIEFSILLLCIILEKLFNEKSEEIRFYESSNFKKLPKLFKANIDSIKKHHLFPKYENYKILEKYNI